MTAPPDLPALVRRHRIVAILRGVPPEQAPLLAGALYGAGIRLLEVALSDEHGLTALRAISALGLPGLLVGAGTVLTPALAQQAEDAGATFVLTPHLIPAVNAYAARRGLGLISGAMTPTELLTARAEGSAVVKLFPAHALGVEYLSSLLGPYPDLPVLAVGGMGEHNIGAFLKAGALGAGVGSALTQTDWSQPDFAGLAARAQALLSIARATRGEKPT